MNAVPLSCLCFAFPMQSLILGLCCFSIHIATSVARHGTCVARTAFLHGVDDVSSQFRRGTSPTAKRSMHAWIPMVSYASVASVVPMFAFPMQSLILGLRCFRHILRPPWPATAYALQEKPTCTAMLSVLTRVPMLPSCNPGIGI